MNRPLRITSLRPVLALVFALATTLHVSSALANDEDKAACADKAEGDDCTRKDGDPGTCVPDESDPVLTCEDSPSSSSSGTGSSSDDGSDDDSSDDDSSDDDGSDDSSSSGCSFAPQGPGSWGAALAVVGALALVRRRAARRA